MKNVLRTNICLVSVTIQKIQSFDKTNKNVIGKMKDESKGKITDSLLD